VLALVCLALIAVVLALPLITRTVSAWRAEHARRRTRPAENTLLYDPGRERRAEQRARASCCARA
jgi:hypothetical protein